MQNLVPHLKKNCKNLNILETIEKLCKDFSLKNHDFCYYILLNTFLFIISKILPDLWVSLFVYEKVNDEPILCFFLFYLFVFLSMVCWEPWLQNNWGLFWRLVWKFWILKETFIYPVMISRKLKKYIKASSIS